MWIYHFFGMLEMPSRTRSEFKSLGQNLRAGARFTLFRPVRPRDFHFSLEQLVALIVLSLILHVLLDLTRSGVPASFNSDAVPHAGFGIVLGLLAWWLVTRWQRRPRELLPMLVMTAAVTPVFVLVELLLAVPLRLEPSGWLGFWMAWVIAGVFLVTVYRIVRTRLRGRWTVPARVTALYASIMLASASLVPDQSFWYAAPAEESEAASHKRVNAEQVFYAQYDLLEQTKAALRPQRPGISDVYFVGFGAYASEDVFMKEVRVGRELFDTRFDSAGRSVALINHRSTSEETPIASATNLGRVLRHLGGVMNREEDVLVLYLTTHGSRNHRLAVDFWPLPLNTINPKQLRQMLDDSGIRWRVIMVSACFSGGFIEALQDPHTLVMTAADAKHESFGCGVLSSFTYFGQALFEIGLRETRFFPDAFRLAAAHIAAREQKERLTPSNPQMVVAPPMEKKLAALARELDRRVPPTVAPATAVAKPPAPVARCPDTPGC